MIGTASKLGGKLGFVQFMSSGAMNNMLLFNGICLAGVFGVLTSVKKETLRSKLLIGLLCLIAVGNIPFAAADEENVYRYIRESGSSQARVNDGTQSTEGSITRGECNEQNCIVSGKIVLTKKDYVGSVTAINLSDDTGTLVSRTVKLVTKDFSSEANLIYDYSQCDYSIGIVEGTSFEGSLDDPETEWKNRNVFYDNADNLIDMSVAPSDLSRLPNNLREFSTSSIQSSGECGSWHTQGTIKSRQVVVPKRDCYNMFQTSDDTVSHLTTEIYLDDVYKKTATLSEMQDGVEIEPGLKVSLLGLNPPAKRKLKMFCRMLDNNIHTDCYEYNYPAIGNPSLEGPGSFQISKVPAVGIDNKESSYYFGRTEWDNSIRWFRQGSECTGVDKAVLEDFNRVKEDWMNERSSVVATGAKLREAIKTKTFKGGQKSLFISKKSEVLDMLGSLGMDEQKRKYMLSALQPRFGGWFLAMMIMLAILIIAASIATPVIMWNNDKDKCCGIERYGTTGLEWMPKFGRNVNDTYGSDLPQFKWSPLQNNGEPMGNSLVLRDASGKVNTYAIEVSNYNAEIDNSKVIVESLEISEVTSFNSGANGNAKLIIFTIGAGGTVKLSIKGAKLMNNFLTVRPGRNTYVVGLMSFEYDKSVVEICIVSETSICSAKEVNFISNPDGENNGLGSEAGKVSVLATFEQVFKSNGWWATTYVLVCILSAIIGILMILSLYNLIMNCRGYNLRGKRNTNISASDALLYGTFMICMCGTVSGEMFYDVNRTLIAQWGTTCYTNGYYRTQNTDTYDAVVILSAADKNFTSNCDTNLWKKTVGSFVFNNETSPCVKGGVDPTFPLEGTGSNKNTFKELWAYKAITRNGSVYSSMSTLPYIGSRKLDMMFISFANLLEFTYNGEVYCDTPYNHVITKGVCSRGGKRICMDSKWTLYGNACGGLITSGIPESFCYGCYSSKICKYSRSDKLNQICFVLDGPSQTSFNMSNEGATVNAYETGVDILMSYNHSLTPYIAAKPLLCEKEILFTYNVIGYQGYFSGSEMWSLKLEMSVEVEGITFNARSMQTDICRTYDQDSFASIGRCIKGKGLAQCVVVCEILTPDRPSTVNGRVKRMMSGRRPKELRNIFGERSVMKKGITREQKRVFEELMNENSRPTISKMPKSVDPGYYENIWFTNEGVAFGAKLGGPYKVSCFYGDNAGSYCNNTQGYGTLSGVDLKSVNSASGSRVVYPEKDQGITLTYEGIDCIGIINDTNGTLRCDTSCCMISFDNFETVSVYYAGEQVHASGTLGLSYVNAIMGRDSTEGARESGIYPQRVNSNYNETCVRGASVSELWVCVSSYYPVQFWGPIGFIIAASVLALVFFLWRFGIKKAAGKTWSAVKGTGSWVNKQGKSIADGIYSRTLQVNKATKLKLAKRLEKGLVLLNKSRGDSKYNEQIKTLRQKMNYWEKGNGMKGERMTLSWLTAKCVSIGTELARYDQKVGEELKETGERVERVHAKKNLGKEIHFN